MPPCKSGCGWSAFGSHPTCCVKCQGPDGPHAKDCAEKNQRVRPACANGCGRPSFGAFPTCCRRCKGPGTPHAADCAEKCVAAAAEPVMVTPSDPPHKPVVDGTPYPGGAGGAHRKAQIRANFLSALHDEYVKRVSGAVGIFFDSGIPDESAAELMPLEDEVRASHDKSCAIALLAQRWHLPIPGPGGTAGIAVAPHGGPVRASGRRKALLVGVNYRGTRAELRGCINDVRNMQRLLTETFGWDARCIRCLTEDIHGSQPTRRNIEAGFHWLANGAVPGDVLFFHFSGHGAEKEDPNGFEPNGMNQTILPLDFQKAGMITDDEVALALVKPLPEGVKMTCLMDCCHSGTCMDLPYKLSKSVGWREEVNPDFSPCDVQMFSGCEDEGTSADMSSMYGAPGGAMTTAFCDVLRANPAPGYVELMKLLYEHLRRRKLSQRPLLTSTQRFDLNRVFLLDEISPNGNSTLGRVVRQRFPPKPRPMHGPLADLLGVGGGLAVGLVGGMLAGALLHELCD